MDHVQRRDLQLRRAARGARRGRLQRHSDTEVLLHAYAPLGRRVPGAAARHVRVRALGRARADAVLRARPLRHQAALLRAGRRRPLPGLRGQGAPAVPARRGDDPRGCRTTSRSSSSSRPHPVPRRRGAPARPLPAGARRRARGPALLGGRVRARLRPHRALLLGAPRGARARLRAAAPALGRAGRRVRVGRRRLRHRRRVAASVAPYPLQGFTGRFDVGPAFDESRYARDLAGAHAFELHEVAIAPRGPSSASSATSSTTSTSRSPALARSRSTSCPSSRRST